MASELVRQQVNVIIAPGSTPAALAAQGATKTTAIVFEIASDPVEVGLVSSLNKRVATSLALAALALMTVFIISLPLELWETVLPITWLFPLLAWIAARYRPAFSAAGAFVVSITIVLTTILGQGHFGDSSLPITDRVLGAQAAILLVALSGYVLAALFAERRESAEYLTQSNTMLERERDNKLMNAQALTAAIAHEVRQPLAAIAANGGAALRFLSKTPPEMEEVRAAVDRMISDTHRTSGVLDGIRALFGRSDKNRLGVDINEIILGVLRSSQKELQDHGAETRIELATKLPLIDGNGRQLEEVIVNLVHNAIEAMDATTNRSRVLRVGTELNDHDGITVAVEDSGPGIDPKQLDRIFDAFFTTKSDGMGLGLAICRMIIEHHGGRLTASSDGKNGSIFQFTLPIVSADQETVDAKESVA